MLTATVTVILSGIFRGDPHEMHEGISSDIWIWIWIWSEIYSSILIGIPIDVYPKEMPMPISNGICFLILTELFAVIWILTLISIAIWTDSLILFLTVTVSVSVTAIAFASSKNELYHDAV